MRKITFSNPGEIDPRLVTTLGVNVKQSDNPIGYFGTGLKYAIAVLLREGCPLTVWEGEKPHHFSVKGEEIRGKAFNFIYMDGSRLGFTTELGKNWTLENAYRELHCNSTDEGGEGGKETEARPSSGTTAIEVEGDAFGIVHDIRYSFILNPAMKPLYVNQFVDVYPGKAKTVFYRGMKVYELHCEGQFTYNIKEKIQLTEDRLLSGSNQLDQWLEIMFNEDTTPKYIIKDGLGQRHGYENRYLQFYWTSFSENMCQAVKELIKEKPQDVSEYVLKAYYKVKGEERGYEEIELTEARKAMLTSALRFSSSIGFPAGEFPIKTAKSLGEGVIATIAKGVIWLSPQSFETEEVLVRSLIEEYVHLRYKVDDMTRSMQNCLFGHIIRLGRKVRGAAE